MGHLYPDDQAAAVTARNALCPVICHIADTACAARTAAVSGAANARTSSELPATGNRCSWNDITELIGAK